MTIEEAKERYRAALHAMQSGVAMKMQYEPEHTEPKSLRVGVNSSFVSQGGLATALINKGIITEAEYIEGQALMMEEEVRSYEVWLSDRLGTEVKLL